MLRLICVIQHFYSVKLTLRIVVMYFTYWCYRLAHLPPRGRGVGEGNSIQLYVEIPEINSALYSPQSNATLEVLHLLRDAILSNLVFQLGLHLEGHLYRRTHSASKIFL